MSTLTIWGALGRRHALTGYGGMKAGRAKRNFEGLERMECIAKDLRTFGHCLGFALMQRLLTEGLKWLFISPVLLTAVGCG